MVYRLSFENELETSKLSLLDDEQKEGEFDELYQAAQIKESQAPEEEPGPDEELSQTDEGAADDEAGVADGGNSEDQEAPVGEEEPALESVFLNHEISHAACLSLEEGEFDDTGSEALKAVGRGLTYLAEAGLEYGAIAAKHIAKGVAIALDHTFKAAVAGGKAIAAYVKKRMESFERFKSRFEEFDKVLQMLKSNAAEPPQNLLCKKESLLQDILSATSASPLDNLDTFKNFFSHIVKEVKAGYVSSAAQLKMLIGKAMSNTVTPPAAYMHDKLQVKGFVNKELSGYNPTEEGIVSYVYNKLLPGNITMVVQIPSEKIKDGPTLIKLNQASKMMLAVDGKAKPPVVQIPYLSFQGLEKFSKSMLEIADAGLQQVKLYGDMDSVRDKLEHSVKAYARHLFDSKEEVTVENSLVNYVSAKFAFMDHTYLAGLMAIHSYTVQYLEACLTFAKDNAKILSR